ncbi:polyphosphate kinase 2 [Notoacmeibacter ruber]|uniref:ADP/GDP-polyphosphate phosphotransferase n=1 Tax=Notoacmeibacter ruber TaxID=2670375 RepID=A0A3L7J9M7_9HYPH|nr:polyphosphate kinase 2 [Notoacmeibacter ruber]RLQ87179.1 polyphosphate kinase 2 [Notoacmeibacter ruber]
MSETKQVAEHLAEMQLQPLDLDLHGKTRHFDIAEPKLPKWIEENAFSSGDYPYDDKLKRKDYEDTLEALQGELVKLHAHMQKTGERLVVLFEGRDAAGKGGTISRFRGHLNPRQARVVALSKPTETEQGQWYFQRYIQHLPTSGEIVLFDRSWYNRAVVEPVMGFCTEAEYEAFLNAVNPFEKLLVDDGIRFFKFWLNIGREMQLERFHDRVHDPLKYWKFSSIDLKGISLWDRYTDYRNRMFEATHTAHAPWTVIRSNDKRRARIEAIRQVLLTADYEGRDPEIIGEPDSRIVKDAATFLAAKR